MALTQLFHKPFSRLLRNRFRALKADMDLVHQAWQTAVREHDFDRQMSLMAHEGILIRDTSAVMRAFHQLIAQELMRTNWWDRDCWRGHMCPLRAASPPSVGQLSLDANVAG